MSSAAAPERRSGTPPFPRGAIAACWLAGSISLLLPGAPLLMALAIVLLSTAAVLTVRCGVQVVGASGARLRPATLLSIAGVIGAAYFFVATPTLLAYGEPSTAQVVAAAIAYPAFLLAPVLSGAGWWLGGRRDDPAARSLGALGLLLAALSLVLVLAVFVLVVAVASHLS